jgi:hypothetical protein
MTTGRRPVVIAAALDLVAAAALFLPWWQASVTPVRLELPPAAPGDAETWSGWEVLGQMPAAVLAVLAVMAVAAALIPAVARGPGRALAAACGVCATSCGVVVLAGWGAGPAPGVWVALLCGVAAVAVILCGGQRAVPAVVALLVIAGTVVVTTPRTGDAAPTTAGPFVRVIGVGAAEFRSGTAELRASLLSGPRLVPIEGATAVATGEGLVRVGGDGRAEVLARFPSPDRTWVRDLVIGVAGDRVAWRSESGTIAVTGLRADDPVAVVVDGVALSDISGRVGSDGVLWLRAIDDRSVRRLDLAELPGTRSIAAADLPLVPGAGEVDLTDLRPVPGGAVRSVRLPGDGYRLERLAPGPGGLTTDWLAGGLDPGCGLVRSARAAYLPAVAAPTPDATGGIWFAVEGEDERWSLARLDPDGTLRAVPHPLPGDVYDLLPTADGGVDLLLGGPEKGLWRLPGAAAALADLPAAPPDCAADPPPAGPPVELLPIADVKRDSLGMLLGADGRWASGIRDGKTVSIALVGPDGSRTPLGQRVDGNLGDVWPDGAGGIWWLEVPRESDLVTLVHARPGTPVQRFAPVVHPSPAQGSGLIPDFGGRPPLLGTAAGAFRIDNGRPELVVPGLIADGVVRADGRGWVLADGRLVALDGDRVLGPVIDAAERGTDPDAPAAVQLARGVLPNRLALPEADVGLDERGRAIVVSDGVVLAVDDESRVTVVAHDTRLTSVRAVEGGLAVYDDGRYSLVALPR